jgi:hypothetical protein
MCTLTRDRTWLRDFETARTIQSGRGVDYYYNMGFVGNVYGACPSRQDIRHTWHGLFVSMLSCPGSGASTNRRTIVQQLGL